MNSAEQFNIGEAALRSGVSAKMVRHCESLGLLPTGWHAPTRVTDATATGKCTRCVSYAVRAIH